MNIPPALAFTALALATSIAAASAASIAVIGDTLPPFNLADQFGKPRSLGDDVKYIYFESDRKGDQLMKSTLTEQGQSHLDDRHAIVVSDISAVPSFVKDLVISDLKERSYTLWLDLKGSATISLPRHANQVTVIELDRRRITAIRYLDSQDQLKRDLGS